MKKTKIAFGVLALAVVLLACALGYALTTRQVSHRGSIIASDNFQLYQDSDCTIPITSLEWGTFGRNTNQHRDGYIKSLAEISINVKWNVSAGAVPSGCVLTMTFNSFGWTANSPKALPVDAVYKVTWTLNAGASASFGDFNFVQTFSASG